MQVDDNILTVVGEIRARDQASARTYNRAAKSAPPLRTGRSPLLHAPPLLENFFDWCAGQRTDEPSLWPPNLGADRHIVVASAMEWRPRGGSMTNIHEGSTANDLGSLARFVAAAQRNKPMAWQRVEVLKAACALPVLPMATAQLRSPSRR